MKIKLIAVGKVKDEYLKLGISDYLNKIKPYSSIEIVEVKDETFKNENSYEINKAKIEEGKRILSQIKNNEYVITLDLNKHYLDSVQFAEFIDKQMGVSGGSLTFVIGGSYGLSEEVKSRSNYGLSLSNMTFLHTMTRLILLEQIFRAFKILSNETYHK